MKAKLRGKISGLVEVSTLNGIIKSDNIEIKFDPKKFLCVDYIKINKEKMPGICRIELVFDVNQPHPYILFEIVPSGGKKI